VATVGGEQIYFGVVGDGFGLASHCAEAIAVETLTPGFFILTVNGFLVGGDH
jgi:hypothetical protein